LLPSAIRFLANLLLRESGRSGTADLTKDDRRLAEEIVLSQRKRPEAKRGPLRHGCILLWQTASRMRRQRRRKTPGVGPTRGCARIGAVDLNKRIRNGAGWSQDQG
jgi:hypothetical protein